MKPFSSKIPYDYESRKKYIDIPFPESEYEERVRKVREMMASHELDALMVFSNPAGHDWAGHLTYLTSFMPHGGNGALLLPMDGEPALVFDMIYHSEPTHSMNWTTWVRNVQPSARGAVSVNVQAWFNENRLDRGRVGLVGEMMFPWAFWDKTLRGLPDTVWSSVTRSFNEIQKRKSPLEMELIRKVCAMTNEGMRAGVDAVSSGVTEGEVVGEIAKEFYRQGAHELSFSHTIASGPRGGLKHSYPTERNIREGDLVYIDIGAKYYGYHTDMSRVVVVGKPNEKQRELLELDREAYYTLLDMIRPGVPVSEIHSRAIELEEKSGFYERYGEGSYIQLSAGHAMSTGFAEWTLEDGVTLLEPNLSPLAFEPMITMLDFGTIVIESMVAITGKGNEVLTPLEVDWMIMD